MAKSIRFDDSFVESAEIYAEVANRSVPKQIEHWAKIGRIAEDNPDLPYSFISDALVARSELTHGVKTKYVRRSKRK